jgi:opacity protein-like surface antigen
MKCDFKFSFVLLLMMCASFAFSQLGIRGGVNLANIAIAGVGSEELDLTTRLCYGAGFFYELEINDKFSIQPEVNIMQHGTKFEFDFFENVAFFDQVINYVQTPVMAKMTFGDKSSTSFFAQAGPYIGYGLNGSIRVCIDDECDSEELNWDEVGLNRLDFGLQLGAGVNLSRNVFLDVRYILGMANLAKEVDEGESLKNTGINISLGYKF